MPGSLTSSYVLVDSGTSIVTDIVGRRSIGGAPGQDKVGLGSAFPPSITWRAFGCLADSSTARNFVYSNKGMTVGVTMEPWQYI